MPDYRCQIVSQPLSTDQGRDYITNVLWYSPNTTGPNAIGDALATAFAGSSGPYYGFHQTWVKVYDHANPLHSPPVYTKLTPGHDTATLGPRQVAICLSFYSGLNVRGQRGRIYVGPWNAAMMAEYVPAGAGAMMNALMAAIKNPGGPDVIQRIHHVKTDSFSNVSNWFWNNRWDTMRSRLPKETARTTG